MKRILPFIIALIFLVVLGFYDYEKKMMNDEKTESTSVTETESVQQVEDQPVTSSGKTGINEGDTAPDFQLSSLSGKPIKLTDYRGKKVVINLWASWCPPCKAEMPHMQAFYEEQERKDTEIIAVNLTKLEKDVNAPKQFVKENDLTFPIAMDDEGKAGEMYQAFSIPTSYIINKKGVIMKKVVGPMSKEFLQKTMESID
ncbi:redoxin domain-containing protein [Fictibacillus fluitans]|uniref:Redoxin domain-containing protein n=1 Tax=Fictibacillus fluitans TaxID=3058422 RepID=A0ABT8HRE6_9BACL|nr:redoxin domain-containing protein [Fictibacillus sp. NE201]MDN4523338.1 redoxin domain-containing protein [Fictibacillus sp. NE201]